MSELRNPSSWFDDPAESNVVAVFKKAIEELAGYGRTDPLITEVQLKSVTMWREMEPFKEASRCLRDLVCTHVPS